MSMNIVVCVKFAPDAADIIVRPDGSISLDRAEWGIGNFDLQAIEAAVQLAEASQGRVIALSAGPARINNSKLRKDLLSRGPDELVLIADDALAAADTAVTSGVLAAALAKLQPVDLVLFGEGSADLYFQQVGLQVGERLGILSLNAVSKIELESEKLVVERSLEDEVEVIELALPAALAVTTDINQPRLPSMREILKAGQKPVKEWSLADLGMTAVENKVEVLRVMAPPRVARKKVLLEGSPEEAAAELTVRLSQEGIL